MTRCDLTALPLAAACTTGTAGAPRPRRACGGQSARASARSPRRAARTERMLCDDGRGTRDWQSQGSTEARSCSRATSPPCPLPPDTTQSQMAATRKDSLEPRGVLSGRLQARVGSWGRTSPACRGRQVFSPPALPQPLTALGHPTVSSTRQDRALPGHVTATSPCLSPAPHSPSSPETHLGSPPCLGI